MMIEQSAVLQASVDFARSVAIERVARTLTQVAGRRLLKKKKIENCTILIPKGNSYCRCERSARGPRFKVSSEGLSAEIDIPQRSPIKVQTRVDVA